MIPNHDEESADNLAIHQIFISEGNKSPRNRICNQQQTLKLKGAMAYGK